MTTDSNPWAINAHGLTRTFPVKKAPDVVAVDHIDLKVSAGQVFGLLGPNGAGKTTTFRMLTTLLPPTSGTATVAGFDLAQASWRIRARIGLVGQLGGADPDATVTENLVLAARLYGQDGATASLRTAELLQTFDLDGLSSRIVKTLSGGQRRRLEIAIGMVHRPSILFLDEPTTGLDPQNRANLWQQVRQLRDDGVTIVLTTHYLDEADALADQLCVMDHGRIIAEGSPAELKSEYHTDSLDAVFLGLTGRQLRDTGDAS